MMDIPRVWTYEGEKKVHYILRESHNERHLWAPTESALGIALLESEVYRGRVETS